MITYQHILTAAHCLFRKEPPKRRTWFLQRPETIYVGMADHDQESHDKHEVRIVATRLIPHPMFATPGNKRKPHEVEWEWEKYQEDKFDIGIIQMEKTNDVRDSRHIRPLWPDLCFARQRPSLRTNVILTGWGRREDPDKIDPNNPDPKCMLGPERCSKRSRWLRILYTKIGKCDREIRNERQVICAFLGPRVDEGSCSGDSGG